MRTLQGFLFTSQQEGMLQYHRQIALCPSFYYRWYKIGIKGQTQVLSPTSPPPATQNNV